MIGKAVSRVDWRLAAVAAAICAAFVILNHGALHGYFRDDDFDTLSWVPYVPLRAWIEGLLTPAFLKSNFRPMGHLAYAALDRAAGPRFAPYLIALQALHLLNALSIFAISRSLRVSRQGAAAAAALFALGAAALPAYWEPMYGFDALCGAYCLASLLAYLHGRLVLSFLAFWLAYKSKELAVMLPFVLLAYEFLLGQRRWKRLIPFLLVALSFGIQGMLLNPNRDNEYAFHFSWGAFSTTIPFYAGRLLLITNGVALAVACALFLDRRSRPSSAAMKTVFFGAIWCALFLVPLLGLPGRISSAYAYVPEAGVALAFGAALGRARRVWVAAVFALWLPWNVRELRIERRAILASAEQVRPYFASMRAYASRHPNPPPLLFENEPPDFHAWGVTGAVKLAWNRPDLPVTWRYAPEGKRIFESGAPFVDMVWSPPERKMRFVTPSPEGAP